MVRSSFVRVLFTLTACALALSTARPAAASQTTPDVIVIRAAGRVVVEVAEAGVAIRKELSADGSLVTITTPKDHLQLRVAGGDLVAMTPGGSAKVTHGTPDETTRLLALLQQSDAATRGLALLRRLPVTSRNMGQQALLMTRVVLEAGMGRSPAMAITRRWVDTENAQRSTTHLDRPGVRRVNLAGEQLGSSPGECWDKYVAEIGRIANDYEECTKDLRWYHAIDCAGCTLLFTIRAEAAALWFLNCNGGLPFVS